MICPFCKSEKVDAEYVDVGVGWVQVTPYECFDCGAREYHPDDNDDDADNHERAVGWRKGQYWEELECNE